MQPLMSSPHVDSLSATSVWKNDCEYACPFEVGADWTKLPGVVAVGEVPVGQSGQ